MPADFAVLESEARSVLEPLVGAHALVIGNMVQYSKAAEHVKELIRTVDRIEAQRKTYTQPLDEAKRKIMADVKKLIQPLEQAIDAYKKVMGEFHATEQSRLNEEQKKIDAEGMAKSKESGQPVVVSVVNNIKTVRSEGATTTVRKKWTFKVVDFDKVPRDFLEVNTSFVRAAIGDGAREIPGLEIYQEDVISIR